MKVEKDPVKLAKYQKELGTLTKMNQQIESDRTFFTKQRLAMESHESEKKMKADDDYAGTRGFLRSMRHPVKRIEAAIARQRFGGKDTTKMNEDIKSKQDEVTRLEAELANLRSKSVAEQRDMLAKQQELNKLRLEIGRLQEEVKRVENFQQHDNLTFYKKHKRDKANDERRERLLYDNMYYNEQAEKRKEEERIKREKERGTYTGDTTTTGGTTTGGTTTGGTGK